MPSYGPIFDPDEGIQHAAVSDVVSYERITTLYTRKVGNGSIECELLRANKPARRLVRLVARFEEGGELVQVTWLCQSELEERVKLEHFEQRILEASRKPVEDLALAPSESAE